MSTMPWGTMNGWLRTEAEQRGKWQQLRVQDLRAAQVATRQAAVEPRPAPAAARREATAGRESSTARESSTGREVTAGRETSTGREATATYGCAEAA